MERERVKSDTQVKEKIFKITKENIVRHLTEALKPVEPWAYM